MAIDEPEWTIESEPVDDIRVELDGGRDIEAVVLAFRKDGELFELAELPPPVRAEITAGDG
jgi:hypothetical protein